uniref:Alcohol dehydrogenase n=1 Tax=Ganoderma boninense TaxID=34458 RepID=A0A5K1K6V2_9APHY|nr:Alcohol dehydrogenase [Ganoderma boninense]
MASLTKGRTLKRADPSTIHDKFLVGYQGWFTCPGDGKPVGPGHHGWLHWFNYPIPNGGRPNTDLWPDTSEYTPSELFAAPGLRYADGEQAFVFSSRHPRTVQRHFNWMALHGVDGAFLQRFLGQCDVEQGNEGIRRQRDEVGDRVREAAEKEGRVYAIMYDISGVAPDRIQRVLEHDWIHLIRRRGVLDSPAYLREQGRPVVALWGFGMSDAHHSPETVRAVTRFIRDNTPGGAYIMAGAPAHWRTSVMDADPNPEFVRVYMEEFDAISPWTVGRYSDEDGADRFEEEKIKGDVEFIKAHNERWEMHKNTMRKIDYIPVVHPGGSGYNLSEGRWKWNDAPRNGGRYLWRQVYNVRRHNVRTVYGAMWDEYDEGTAFMPVVSHKRQVPVHEQYRFMALDEDGFDLPPDWYMRICGFAVEGLRGERLVLDTFPSKELQDYWSSRPHYEDEAGSSSVVGGSGSGSGSAEKEEGQTWEEWSKMMQSKENGDEPPPPPYSLEADEPQSQAASPAAPPVVPLERRPSTQVQAPPSTPCQPAPLFPLSTAARVQRNFQ